MSMIYAQKSKYRITLEIDVFEDFNPHNVDWGKLLDIQGNEKVSSCYVEDLSTPDNYYS